MVIDNTNYSWTVFQDQMIFYSNKLNSFTSDAMILGVSSYQIVLRATFSNPSSLNDASDPLILVPEQF